MTWSEALENFLENNKTVVDTMKAIWSELTNVINALAEVRLATIDAEIAKREEALTADMKAIDEQIAAAEEANLTDEERKELIENLEAEKVAAREQADAEIRALERQAAQPFGGLVGGQFA